MSQLEALIRQIVREEIAAVMGTPTGFKKVGEAVTTHNMTTTLTMPDNDICGAPDPKSTRVCQKPKHKGRHLFTAVPTPKPDNGWRDIQSFRLKGTGSKSYEIKVGNPVKVKGYGRGGAAQPGWYVTSIQQRGEDINVGVRKDRTGPERTVKSDRIIYMRPKKVK